MGTTMKYIGMTILVAALTSVATPALAHPVPKSYSPEDGSTISTPPSEAMVEFDEEISQGTLVVYDPCGERVDSGSTQVLLTRVSVAVAADKAGTYTSVWTVIGQDGHKVSGDWTFTVTDGGRCPAAEPEEPKDGSGSKADPSGGNDDTKVNATGGSNDDNSAVASGGGKGTGNSTKGKGKKHHHQAGTIEATDNPVTDDGTTTTNAAADVPVPGDIPLDWLMISFGVAALIGAAAGQIYVNLVEPRPKPKTRRNN